MVSNFRSECPPGDECYCCYVTVPPTTEVVVVHYEVFTAATLGQNCIGSFMRLYNVNVKRFLSVLREIKELEILC